MKRHLPLLLAALLAQSAWAESKTYPRRWVFVIRSLRSDRDVDQIREIARVASEHGLNGLVLSGGLDQLERQPPEFVERLKKVKAILDERGLELIPQIFSAGYGGSVLAFDRNLAEGIPVLNAPYLVRNGEARFVPDPAVRFANGGLEEHSDGKLKGYQHQEQPGVISFVDTAVAHQGKTSLRFENLSASERGLGRLMQEIAVTPRRQYRVTCWVKTESLTPAGALRIQVLGAGDRNLAPWNFSVPATADWLQLTLGFNSFESEKIKVWAGAWGAKGGKFWIDDLRIEETGLVNVVRRPGTPVAVRDAATGRAWEEGRDFAAISDPKLNFRFDHDGPAITIPPGSRIRDGDRLQADYYHGIAINRGQVSVCMSEPQLYRIWREQTRRLHELLAPRTYLLSMDEIRAGGSDVACKERRLTMAEILGDCFTKQFRMLRELNPQAEVFTWSDMLDPNHNARGNYYLVEGDYTGSWKHVPKEMRIVCWYYERRNLSLPFFSGLGFKTLAGAYYDADTLDNPKGWLEALDRTPGALGIMYTTWRNKYDLLPGFGDLATKR